MEEAPDLVTFRFGEKPDSSDIITNIFVDSSDTETSEELMKYTLNGLRGSIDKIHSIEDKVTLGGKPAYKVDFSFEDDPNEPGDTLLHVIQYIMVNEENGMMYSIMCNVSAEKFTKYQPIIEKMADSFKIVG